MFQHGDAKTKRAIAARQTNSNKAMTKSQCGHVIQLMFSNGAICATAIEHYSVANKTELSKSKYGSN